jgi:hypothetical protein
MKSETPNNTPPGPWSADGNTVYALDHGKHYTIARANGARLTDEAQVATARLIAAAPQLAEALRQCQTYLNEWCAITTTPEGRKAMIAMNAARAALAAAGVKP